jgi:hypothetical protein
LSKASLWNPYNPKYWSTVFTKTFSFWKITKTPVIFPHLPSPKTIAPERKRFPSGAITNRSGARYPLITLQ